MYAAIVEEDKFEGVDLERDKHPLLGQIDQKVQQEQCFPY
jgi:hypothetical protein